MTGGSWGTGHVTGGTGHVTGGTGHVTGGTGHVTGGSWVIRLISHGSLGYVIIVSCDYWVM